jgi:hypothetical protein
MLKRRWGWKTSKLSSCSAKRVSAALARPALGIGEWHEVILGGVVKRKRRERGEKWNRRLNRDSLSKE